MEQCHLCGRAVLDGEAVRQVLPVGTSHGLSLGLFGGGPRVYWSVHSAPVTRCPACAATETTRLAGPLWWTWAKILFCGWIVFGLMEWLLSAGIQGVLMLVQAGHWGLGLSLLAFAVWRTSTVVQRSRTRRNAIVMSH